MPSNSLLELEPAELLNRFRKFNLAGFLSSGSCLVSLLCAGEWDFPFELADNRVASLSECERMKYFASS
jgi:hypothetical protein